MPPLPVTRKHEIRFYHNLLTLYSFPRQRILLTSVRHKLLQTLAHLDQHTTLQSD